MLFKKKISRDIAPYTGTNSREGEKGMEYLVLMHSERLHYECNSGIIQGVSADVQIAVE